MAHRKKRLDVYRMCSVVIAASEGVLRNRTEAVT